MNNQCYCHNTCCNCHNNCPPCPPCPTCPITTPNPGSSRLGLGNKKILCGYWFEWYPRVDPATIPLEYNMICVAFLETRADGIPSFKPAYMSDSQFIAAVNRWKAEGREVIISLGGELGKVALYNSQKDAFVAEMKRIFDLYGFTGFDIDLEGHSILAAENTTVIPNALKELKNYYNAQNKKFLITMAPEFPHLRGSNASYRPFIQSLTGYYDVIFPQFYNQGADGIWSDELNMYIAQNNDQYKAAFLYSISKALITGTKDYIQIPADKFAIGLPSSRDAASNGYVVNPADIQTVLDKLLADGYDIRGLMTWSINQDANNGYEYVNRYAPMLNGAVNPGDNTPPSAPTNLRVVGTTQNSISLQWTPSTDNVAIEGYTVFRNGTEVRIQPGTTYTDSGLNPDTSYTYRVSAYDTNGNVSALSATVTGRTDAVATNPIQPPYNLTASNVTASSVQLNWAAPTRNTMLASYNIYRNGVKIATVDKNMRSYLVSGLTANTNYTFAVSANDVNGNESALSNSVTIKTQALQPQKPQAPTNLRATNIENDLVSIAWNAPTNTSNIAGYHVYRNGIEFTTVGTGTLAFTDIGLTPNTTYSYKIAAFSQDGTLSDFSNTISVTTKDAVEPPPTGGTWNANTIYYEGDIVTYGGYEYRAKWYSQGEAPDGQNANSVWTYLSADPLPWRNNIPYAGNDLVLYNNKVYRSKIWVSPGVVPGTETIYWELV